MPVAQVRQTIAKTSDTADWTAGNQHFFQAQPDRESPVATRFVAAGIIFRIQATRIWVLATRPSLQMSVFVVTIRRFDPTDQDHMVFENVGERRVQSLLVRVLFPGTFIQ